MKKERLDRVLFDRGMVKSREAARAIILSGKVYVGGEKIDKAGAAIDPDAPITVSSFPAYVSRGGDKLAGAMEAFGIGVAGLIAIDVGASTGGFTDYLLQHGAMRVYAIDVGYGQLADILRQDARVVVLDRQNIRYLREGAIPEKADLAVIDVSFISLEKVIPSVFPLLKGEGQIVALVKPQFEVGKGEVGSGGIVRCPEQHQAVLDKIIQQVPAWGKGALFVLGAVPSALTGKKGNQEFFVHIKKSVGAIPQ